MTLKEKFQKLVFDIEISNEKLIEKSEKIADEYAIEFGEYLDSLTTEDMGTTPIKEFLEFFKKEKGL